MTMMLESVDMPEDEVPDIDSPGTDSEAPYGYTKSGRIRKRPLGNASGDAATPKRNERQARQATAVLMQVNGLMAAGALMAGMLGTAAKLSERHDKFENDVYNALCLDPGMCAIILKGGLKSGKMMLLIACLSHGIAVAPTAFSEYREL